jgi:hypothetical protein
MPATKMQTKAEIKRAAEKMADWLFMFNVDVAHPDKLDAIISDALDLWLAGACSPEDAARIATGRARA